MELSKELLKRGRAKKAKKVLEKVNLKGVRELYKEDVARLWLRLRLPAKQLVLRFPELATELIDRVPLSKREKEKVFNRLLAKKKYKEVINLDSSPCKHRGIALFRLRLYEEAVDVLKNCKSRPARRYLLLTYIKLGRTYEAEHLLQTERDPHLYLTYGMYLFRRGIHPKAKEYLLRAGNNQQALFYAGLVEYLGGNYKASYRLLSQAQKFAENAKERAKILFWKAKVARKMGLRNVSHHLLRESARAEGFYSIVSKKLLGEPLYLKTSSLPLPRSESSLLKQLKAIKELGFLHYMRKEALRLVKKLNETDILHLSFIDPFLAIRVSADKYGVDSQVYTMVAFPLPFKDIVKEVSEKFEVEPSLIYGVMRQESLFDPLAVSVSDAKGLMQLLDSTARWISNRINYSFKDIFEPKTNITLGTAYLRFLTDLWKGDLIRVIASYNAGQGAVSRWKRYGDDFLFIETIPFQETRRYVKRVLWFYYVYKEKLSYEPF